MIASVPEVTAYLLANTTLTPQQLGLVNMLLPIQERVVKKYLQSEVEQVTHTEYLAMNWREGDIDNFTWVNVTPSMVSIIPRGRSTDVIQLKFTPVTLDGLQVWEQPTAYAGQNSAAPFDDTALLTLGTDYWLDCDVPGLSRNGHIRRVGAWPNEPRAVKITYQGGWSRSQLDEGEASPIKMAVIIACAKAVMTAIAQSRFMEKEGAIVAENLGGYSATYRPGSENPNFNWSQTLPPECLQLLQPFRNYGRLLI